jgi:uncharacterized radical SAM superfamily protein
MSLKDEVARALGRESGIVRSGSSTVTLNIPLWEWQQEQKQAERRRLRELDPYRLGIWGPIDDE